MFSAISAAVTIAKFNLALNILSLFIFYFISDRDLLAYAIVVLPYIFKLTISNRFSSLQLHIIG